MDEIDDPPADVDASNMPRDVDIRVVPDASSAVELLLELQQANKVVWLVECEVKLAAPETPVVTSHHGGAVEIMEVDESADTDEEQTLRVDSIETNRHQDAPTAVTGHYLLTKPNWSMTIALAFVMKKIPSFKCNTSNFALLNELSSRFK